MNLIAFQVGFQEKMAAHLLVTGPSGSGKTTYARQLAKREGLPLQQLDLSPEWIELWGGKENLGAPHPDEPKLSDEEWLALRRQATLNALASKDPSVIEGLQVLALTPEELEGHKLYWMATPEEDVVRQTWNRYLDDKARGEPVFQDLEEESFGEGTRELYKQYLKEFEKLKDVLHTKVTPTWRLPLMKPRFKEARYIGDPVEIPEFHGGRPDMTPEQELEDIKYGLLQGYELRPDFRRIRALEGIDDPVAREILAAWKAGHGARVTPERQEWAASIGK